MITAQEKLIKSVTELQTAARRLRAVSKLLTGDELISSIDESIGHITNALLVLDVVLNKTKPPQI